MHAERGHRVGEARAVHVHAQLPAAGDSGNRPHLVHRVDRAHLGRLRERDHLGLGVVDVGAARDQRLHRVGRQLAVGALGGQQLGTVGEELGAAALVRLDVRQLMADDGVVRLAQRGQRQRIGGGAIEDEKDFAIGLEQIADAVAYALRPGIVAVGGLVAAAVRFQEVLQGFRAEAGVVVGGEVLHGGSGWRSQAGGREDRLALTSARTRARRRWPSSRA